MSTQAEDSTTNFTRTQIAIIVDFPITKINDRVFEIGNLDNYFLINYFNIFNVINKGFKFIPCFFDSGSNFLSFCEYLFQEFLINFNKRIFFLKSQLNHTSETSAEIICNESIPPNIPIESEDSNHLDTIIKKLNLNKRINRKYYKTRP